MSYHYRNALLKIKWLFLICLACIFFHPNNLFANKANVPARAFNGIFDSIPKQTQFGMRARKIPENTDQIFEPVIIKDGPTNEATMIRLSSGIIKIFYINRPGKADKMMSIESMDEGIKWSEPKIEFDLPGEAYYANRVLQDSDRTIHCIFHIYGTGNKGYRGKHLDLWYTKMESGKEWERPKKIFDGYVGSIRGFIKLKNNRLLIPMSEADPLRANKPTTGEIDYGLFETICLYSDDLGANWKKSETHLKIPVESTQVTRYGAVEPNVIQLKNGKLWMLIRTNKGFLYESFSKDNGNTWDQTKPSIFISSDSPAETVRLSDGSILLLWNSNQRYDNKRSYANGGREVLHAAFSKDEGKTWQGFREIFTSEENPAIKGDRGTAYASAIETGKGKILFIAGQGEGGRSIVCFDPNWLRKKEATDNFTDGLLQWTLFGTDNEVRLENFQNQKALHFKKSDPTSTTNTSAMWNFPMTKKGEINLKISLKSYPLENTHTLRIALTDHFSIAADTAAFDIAAVHFLITADQLPLTEVPYIIDCKWNFESKKASLFINRKLIDIISIKEKKILGFNYVRVESGKYTKVNNQDLFIQSISSHCQN